MIVKQLVLRNFRNYDYVKVEFDPKLNVIVGENAAGKTNLVEAIYFLSFAKTFRSAKNSDLIKNERLSGVIEAKVEQDTITKDISALISPSAKRFTYNGNRIGKTSDLSQLVNVIVFEPVDVLMFRGSPMTRRDFLDRNLSKKSSIYLDKLIKFEKLLQERNAILKNEEIDRTQLLVVTQQLIDVEESICKFRKAYIDRINEVLPKIITYLKGDKESAKIEYLPFMKIDDKFKLNCAHLYESTLESDIKYKATQSGIHREDFKMILNREDISLRGSQGENRIAAIALKISPYFLFEDQEERPIIILDDVMSELDNDHKQRLLTFVRKLGQVFITSTNTNIQNASVYEVKEHNVTRRNAKW